MLLGALRCDPRLVMQPRVGDLRLRHWLLSEANLACTHPSRENFSRRTCCWIYALQNFAPGTVQALYVLQSWWLCSASCGDAGMRELVGGSRTRACGYQRSPPGETGSLRGFGWEPAGLGLGNVREAGRGARVSQIFAGAPVSSVKRGAPRPYVVLRRPEPQQTAMDRVELQPR